MNTKRKAELGGNPFGSLNQLNHSSGEITVSAFHNARNHAEMQRFCNCGAVIPRDEIIFLRATHCKNCRAQIFNPAPATITPTGHHRKIRLEPCPICLFAFGSSKMCGEVCAECVTKNEAVPKVSPQLLTVAALGNFLHGRAVGGVR